MTKPTVVLSMPRRDSQMCVGAAEGFYLWPTGGDCEVIRIYSESSLLCRGFNQLWSTALNLAPDYFAMIHADVTPEPKWLDILLGELKRLDADVVSAVIPIKSKEGMTSTAVAGDDPWSPRRLSLTEVHDLPETFGAEDVGGPLLLNTGLWVCDFSKPWVREVGFGMQDRIWRDSDGQFSPQCVSEDWDFSHQLHAHNCRLFATRTVRVHHLGSIQYVNDRPWGDWETDRVHESKRAAGPVLSEVSCD